MIFYEPRMHADGTRMNCRNLMNLAATRLNNSARGNAPGFEDPQNQTALKGLNMSLKPIPGVASA